MNENLLKQIKDAVERIRYGSVEIVIHDSKVVQIERKEKLRFNMETKTNEGLTGKPEVQT